MKYILIIVTFLVISGSTYSQSKASRIQESDTTLNILTFMRDSIYNEIRIFGFGSFEPIAFSRNDSLFEIKYKVKYVLYGCEAKFKFEEMAEYNLEVAKYLDRYYGKMWRNELRLDVIALKQ